MEPVTLRTSRLLLSIPTESDVDAIAVAARDPEIPRWTTLPSPYSRADAEEFVERMPKRWATDDAYVWAVRWDGALAGMMGLHHPSGGDAEIGYWIAAPARGHGVAVEAARAAVDWGFAEAGLVRIEWRAAVGNVASARVARRLGFRFEGTLRQGLTSPRGRTDGWVAALLAADDPTPVAWPILGGG